MLKFLIGFLAFILLIRLVLRLLLGSFQIKIEKHYHQYNGRPEQKREGEVSIETGNSKTSKSRYGAEGEYVDYEELS